MRIWQKKVVPPPFWKKQIKKRTHQSASERHGTILYSSSSPNIEHLLRRFSKKLAQTGVRNLRGKWKSKRITIVLIIAGDSKIYNLRLYIFKYQRQHTSASRNISTMSCRYEPHLWVIMITKPYDFLICSNLILHHKHIRGLASST